MQTDMPMAAGIGEEKVEITKVENGWIVKVGCKTFVSKDWEEISHGLKEYYDNPIRAQHKYCVK